jgi:hypothetical protein
MEIQYSSKLRATEEKQGQIQKSDVNFSKLRLNAPRKRNPFLSVIVVMIFIEP